MNFQPPDTVCKFCDDTCGGTCEGATENRLEFSREEIDFIRSEFYASLAAGAEHPLFEAVYQKAKAILATSK